MIAFELAEHQRDLRELAARVAREVYAPLAVEWDRDGTFVAADERRRLADLGFLGICLPEEQGGAGLDLTDALVVIEELAKANQPAAFQVFEANTGPARVIDLFGTPDQRDRWLTPIVAGEATMAVAISEPDAGSAATDIATTAVPTTDGYVINGMKRWCSGGGHAELYLVYVRLDDTPGARGIGAIVVEAGTPGLTFGPNETLHGFHGIPSADLFFDGVTVPAENLVVGAGGFKRLFGAFSIERLGNATMSLAIGQACLDRTSRYVQERRQFGKPLIEFQAVQLRIADMLLAVEGTRLLIWRAAAAAGRGVPDTLAASLAKCHANEMAKAVSDTAMELHGGYGYHPEYEVERMHRDAHGWAMGGGTPTIQRIRIASEYLGLSFNQRS